MGKNEYAFIQYCWIAKRQARLKGEIIYFTAQGLQELKVQDCLYAKECRYRKSPDCLIGHILQSIWVKE